MTVVAASAVAASATPIAPAAAAAVLHSTISDPLTKKNVFEVKYSFIIIARKDMHLQMAGQSKPCKRSAKPWAREQGRCQWGEITPPLDRQHWPACLVLLSFSDFSQEYSGEAETRAKMSERQGSCISLQCI